MSVEEQGFLQLFVVVMKDVGQGNTLTLTSSPVGNSISEGVGVAVLYIKSFIHLHIKIGLYTYSKGCGRGMKDAEYN